MCFELQFSECFIAAINKISDRHLIIEYNSGCRLDTTGFFFDNAWVSIYSLNWLQLCKVLWFTTSFAEFKLNVSKPVKWTCLLVASSPAIRDSIVSGYLQTIFIWSSLVHQFFYLHHTGCFEKNDFTSKLVSSIWTLSQCKLSIVVRSSNGFILMIKHIVKPVDAPYHACGIVIWYVLNLVLLSSWFEGRNVHLTWGGFPVGMGYSRTSISNTNPFRNTFIVFSCYSSSFAKKNVWERIV